MAAPNEGLVNGLLREAESAISERSNWDSQWEQVALKVLPFYAGSFNGSINPGSKKNQEQYDVTAMAALWKFSAAMESMLTPASSKWHRLRPTDPIVKRNRAAMEWYDLANDMLFHYRYSPHSAFQANQHDCYVSIGAFGTSCMFTDAYNDPTRPSVRGLRYRHVPLGELYFATNHQGQVDKVFRKFDMSLRNIVQRWGAEKLPDTLKSKLEKNPEEKVCVLHVVKPNHDMDPNRVDYKGKRFLSYYLIKAERVLLEEGGYRVNPYSVARYMTAPGELYGRSPAMNVLPSISVLNEEKKIILKQGHRSVEPVLLMADDGILDNFSMKPGAKNPGGVSADGRPLVHTLPVGNIAVGKEMMDDERQAINDAFLVTLFQILVDTPQMTATEVLERAREKGALLSPTMGRHQSEGIGPMIERECDLLMYQGLIPPPPRIILDAGGDYKVEYDAPLNRAMRAEEAAGTMRSIQWTAEIVAQTQDPSPMDNYNWDVIVPEIADINAVPLRFMRSPEEIASIRENRNAEKMAAQVTQALPGMAAMAKVASPEGTNPNPGQPV